MNYLYNGVELPELPKTHKNNTENLAFDYAIIIDFRTSGSLRLYFLTEQPVKYQVSTVARLGASAVPYYWYEYRLNENNEWEENGNNPAYSNQKALVNLTESIGIVWSKTDIPDEDNDTIYFEGSDPIPVPTPAPLSLVMGYRVGCAIRANR